ncbi:ATP-grasp domain-containing protein [soil metagenome]
MNHRRPRIAVLYNHSTEGDRRRVAHAVTRELKEAGLRAFLLGIAPPLRRVVRRLENQKPDAVLNLVDRFAGDPAGGARIAALLELLRLPFTGSSSEAIAFGSSRARAKARLLCSGLPIAPADSIARDDPIPATWRGPVVVKSEAEPIGQGIAPESVVSAPADLPAQVDRLRAAGASTVLLERYLPGPEYQVGLLALPRPVALPVAEVVFDFDPQTSPRPILTGEGVTLRCPAEIESARAEQLENLAVAAFLAHGGRDLARVDFRLDDRGEPMILAVRLSPDLAPSASWAQALRASGRDYRETLVALAFQAIERGCNA